jgi:hypothetical protein
VAPSSPATLVPGAIRAFAVDGASVFYTTVTAATGEGRVWRQPLSGGPPTMLSGLLYPYGLLAVDGASVYATATNAVHSFSKASGVDTVLASGQSYPWSIGVDGATAYFTALGDAHGAGSVDAAETGGPAGAFAMQPTPIGVAFDSGHVYWTSGRSTVSRAPLGGGAVEAFATGQQLTGGLAASSDTVVWTTRTAVVSAKTGAPTTLAAGEVYPRAVVVSGTDVYWTTPGTLGGAYKDGAVRRAPLAGGPATSVATGEARPSYVATAGQAVYWLTDQGLRWVAK